MRPPRCISVLVATSVPLTAHGGQCPAGGNVSLAKDVLANPPGFATGRAASAPSGRLTSRSAANGMVSDPDEVHVN
jgi:hypothetical protein